MYARKDIRTVLPDAVLRCRKLESAANVELEEMEKAKFRRMNNLTWQQQTFQKTLAERHKRWRMYDRAFRLKLKRELGADLAAALRLRTVQDEEYKFMFEQELIEESLANRKKDEIKNDEKHQPQSNSTVDIKSMTKSTSAHPKSNQRKAPVNKVNQTPVDLRRVKSAATRDSHTPSAVNRTSRLSPHRPRTSRFDSLSRRDTDASVGHRDDFGSVLVRILSNIAATPDLDDDFTIRKRALEARERRIILTKDDRYYNLVKQLAPQKVPGEKTTDDADDTDDKY